MTVEELTAHAKWVRRQVLEMIVSANKGHIGGSLSCTDILVALYQGGILAVSPKGITDLNRDRFIMSKGHACEALYAVLASFGFFPIEELQQYGQPGSMLMSHPWKDIPGVEVSTGALGHGLGIGAGIALAGKLDELSYRTFVLMGDGECYEGSVWEAAMFAAHHKLCNLCCIVDRNRQITLDFTEDCLRLEPLARKWEAFGWRVVEVNGHDMESLLQVFSSTTEAPTVCIANTIKGKGISYMEDQPGWHHAVPKGDMVEIARKDLS